MEAGCAAGGSPVELWAWTWGEIVLLVNSRNRALRQHYQALSVIAWQQAVLTASVVCGGKAEPVYRLFPFWEEDERAALAQAGYRAMMERLAGRGGT